MFTIVWLIKQRRPYLQRSSATPPLFDCFRAVRLFHCSTDTALASFQCVENLDNHKGIEAGVQIYLYEAIISHSIQNSNSRISGQLFSTLEAFQISRYVRSRLPRYAMPHDEHSSREYNRLSHIVGVL